MRYTTLLILALLSTTVMAQIPKTGLELENEYLKLTFDRTHKTLTIAERQSGGYVPIIGEFSMMLRLQGNDSLVLRDAPGSVTARQENVRDGIGIGTRYIVTYPGTRASWQISYTLYSEARIVTLSALVKNLSGDAWKMRDFRLIDPAQTGRMYFASDNVLMQLNGYQSWSACSIKKLDTAASGPSYWSTVFTEPDANRSTVIGFLDNRHAVNTIQAGAFQPRGGTASVTVSSDLHTLVVPAGGEWQSDRMMISLGPSPQRLLGEYARAMQTFADSIPKPFTPDGRSTLQRKMTVPTGWCSWYYYYQNISEDSILANIDVVEQHLRNAGMEYIQIDDGYQLTAGDWDTNKKFPHGHRWLVDQIHRRGLKAGLWVAPFAIAESSTIFREHPNWLLKGEGDSLRQFSANSWWGGRIYSLDPTVPDVRNWLRMLFEKITTKWGYDYVKIDFLYFAAEGAAYHQPVSPIEAYRLGMAAIRKGVGPEKVIVGCGAPIGPSVGYVDAMRIGTDVYAGWGGITPCVNALVQRAFYHDAVWYNDPDCLVVRPPITLDQARVWASAIALSGQMPLASDKLPVLAPERLNLVDRTLPSYGVSAEQVDLFTPPVDQGLTLLGPNDQRLQIPTVWKISPGDSIDWKEPAFDDSNWKNIPVPSRWEDQGFPGKDGFFWYRVKFTLPHEWTIGPSTLYFARIDDCDQTYLNGNLIGKTGEMPPGYEGNWDEFRIYPVPAELLHAGENTLAVRVYDGGGPGGIWSTKQFSLPSLWNLPVAGRHENWNLVGVFNWSRSTDSYKLASRNLDLSAKKTYLVYEYWSDRYLGELRGTMRLNLAPTSCNVLAIHEKRDIPTVLSTSRHITQGAIDIAAEAWDPTTKILSVTSKQLLHEPYRVTFLVPEGMKFSRVVTTEEHNEKEVAPGIWQVTFEHPKKTTLDWGVEVQ